MFLPFKAPLLLAALLVLLVVWQLVLGNMLGAEVIATCAD
jgi:hypothetical protein